MLRRRSLDLRARAGVMIMNDEKKLDALGIGDALVDLTTFVPRIPLKGGNVWGTAATLEPGGTTANVASNLARLGMRSGFSGCLGDDHYGQYALEEMQSSNVEVTDVIILKDSFTGLVFAAIDEDGERTFIACARGAAHSQLQVEHIEKINFKRAKIVHASGVCLVEEPARTSLLTALKRLRDLDIPVFYDPNLRLEGDIFPVELRQAQWEAIELSHMVLVGDGELALLTGQDDLNKGVEVMQNRSHSNIIVKRGSEGLWASIDGKSFVMPSHEIRVVDTKGAGDAFNAGYIAAEAHGLDVPTSLNYASAVAAIKVSRKGARSVPTHDEIMAFLSENSAI